VPQRGSPRLRVVPYTRSYYRLLAPVAGSFAVLWLARSWFSAFQPAVVMGVSVILAYAVFGAIALLFGLDADDRLLAGAVWTRLRGGVSGAR